MARIVQCTTSQPSHVTNANKARFLWNRGSNPDLHKGRATSNGTSVPNTVQIIRGASIAAACGARSGSKSTSRSEAGRRATRNTRCPHAMHGRAKAIRKSSEIESVAASCRSNIHEVKTEARVRSQQAKVPGP